MSSIFHKTTGMLACALIATMLFTACHDDPEYISTDPSVEKTESGHHITSFSLKQEHFPMPDDIKEVLIALISADGETSCFKTDVEREANGRLRFHINLPAEDSITDGNYVMTMRRPDGSSIPGRLWVRFESGLASEVKIIIPRFMLDGSGTEEDPYLIQNDDDFSMFLINLADDEDVYGAGLKFVQTADVTAPDQSSLIAGRGYWGSPFAGIYDGQNHKVKKLYYRGSGREDSDSGIGMFIELLGTASVSNLTFTETSISGLHSKSGLVAGTTSGDITLSNITVGGYINDGYAIGGLVGDVTSGTLTVTDTKFGMSVKGTNDVGGLVGRVEKDAKLVVDGVSTPDTHFGVEGQSSVGGIVGRPIGASEISNVRLDHKVSNEDSDIRIITGSGSGIGGIIGTIPSDAPDQKLRKCYVLCPVGGTGSNVGGIIGQLQSAGSTELDECRVYSVVRGNTCVGGIIGKADMSGTLKITGTDYSTRVAADDADAKVEGSESTGGFCGWWKGSLAIGSKVRINVPVSGGTSTGGAFGTISNCTVNFNNIEFGQSATNVGNTMRISGTDKTGGLAGSLDKATLEGESKFDFSENGGPLAVPAPDRFVSAFDCVVKGETNTGGAVGYAKDSKVKALCNGAAVTGTTNVGGVVGGMYDSNGSSHLEDCTYKGRLECPAAVNIGGIAGYFESRKGGSIQDCVNYAAVKGGENTGGVIGHLRLPDPMSYPKVALKWCVNKGAVEGQIHIGGILGYHSTQSEINIHASIQAEFSVENCMNAASVTGQSQSTSTGGVGGIIGFSGALIEVFYCANHGDITGSGPFHGIGGIAGSLGQDPLKLNFATDYRNLDVKECTNTGTIDADNRASMVGGILGYQEEGYLSDVNNCHNLGAVPCAQSHDTGGIVGYVDHETNIHRCVNQGQVSHGNAAIGTHKSGSLFDHSSLYYLEGTGAGWPSATKVSKANFSKQSSFGGLDFTQVWKMTADGPVLARCPWRDPALAK